MEALECATTDLDTPAGGGVELFTRTADGRASLTGAPEQAATEEPGLAINGTDAGNPEQIGWIAAALRLTTDVRWEELRIWLRLRNRLCVWVACGANELTRPAGFGFHTPQAVRIEDCAGWATHYWVERK